MSNLQDEAWDINNVVRRANSHWNARRPAEPPQGRSAAIAAELKEALAREAALLREKDEILQQQIMLTQEFEHRLVNSLQLIVSLLSLQSRNTESPEAAAHSADFQA